MNKNLFVIRELKPWFVYIYIYVVGLRLSMWYSIYMQYAYNFSHCALCASDDCCILWCLGHFL